MEREIMFEMLRRSNSPRECGVFLEHGDRVRVIPWAVESSHPVARASLRKGVGRPF
jgi:hypothetical protein